MATVAPMRLRGGRDLTTGPIGRAMLMFALPMMATSALQSLNGSINAIWVGRLLGEAGLTATVNANNILFLLLGAVLGVGMASTILIAQAVGARNLAQAKRVVGTSASFFLATSLLVATAGFALADPILTLMGTPEAAHRLAVDYLRIIFLALPVMYMLTFAGMALRGAGDSRTPFRFTMVACVLDIILTPLLIAGWGPAPALGISGAAMATLLSQGIALAALMTHAYARSFDLRLVRGELHLLRPDPVLLRATILKGLPMGAQMLVISLSGLVMVGIVNGYGTATAAGYGVAMQLWSYVVMPALAVGAAASTTAAQNVGAGLWARVERTALAGIALNLALTGALILVVYAVERPLIALFLPGGADALAVTHRVNQVGLWGHLMLGVAFVLFAVVRATGAVMAPLAILAISLLGVRIPLALWLEPRLGAEAVWWTAPVSMGVAMLLAILYFRFGPWRAARMLPPSGSLAPASAPAQANAGAGVPAAAAGAGVPAALAAGPHAG